jgi:LysM repeat protein
VVVVVLAVLTICVVLSAVRVTSSASTGSPPPPAPAPVHVVEPGETLWGIAAALAPQADTRLIVARLAELNGLASAEVRPGQVLLLP